MTSNAPSVLVCTLGGKAQVATFTIDALLQQNVDIKKVVVIHHAPPQKTDRLRAAIALLQEHLPSYYKRQIALELVPIRNKEGIVTDLNEASAVSATWETLNQTIEDLQKRNFLIHFCFTGGRRLLAMQAMSVLSLHATPDDTLWHLYTPTLMRDAAATHKILHATERPDLPEPYLVKVPLVPWSYFFKGLRQLLQLNPLEAMQKVPLFDEQNEKRVQQAWRELRSGLQDTLYHLAKGKSPQEIANELGSELTTVQGYITEIHHICRTEWGLDEKHRPSFEWFQQKFAPFIDNLPRKSAKRNKKNG